MLRFFSEKSSEYVPKYHQDLVYECAFWALRLHKRGIMSSASIWSGGMSGNGVPSRG